MCAEACAGAQGRSVPELSTIQDRMGFCHPVDSWLFGCMPVSFTTLASYDQSPHSCLYELAFRHNDNRSFPPTKPNHRMQLNARCGGNLNAIAAPSSHYFFATSR
jgi:hypothetical protein